jgi:mono/diheme cytochrome c family protein
MSRLPLRILAAAWLGIGAIGSSLQAAAQPQSAGGPAVAAPMAPHAVINKYCVSCHNQRLKTAGLVLDKVDVANAPAHAEVWEKVIRKLRTGAMPPAGLPRPDKQTYRSLISTLETAIDRDASARPNPGRTETFHRLNRAEYKNAIRDLLAIEIDVASQLPVDDMSHGFDNMAGMKMTPTLLDSYMVAARQVTRVAIGNPALGPTAETFRLKADLSQDVSFDALPIGTRGGTAIRYHFPLDGEYQFTIETLGGGNDEHQLEVSIDGDRVHVFTLKPARRPGGGDLYQEPDSSPQIRVPVKAGPRLVGVTFVKKTAALAETIRDPFDRPHAEGGVRLQPSLESVTITGPFAPTGVSDTPSRRRIFSCRPSSRAAEAGCAKQILATMARRAYRRPVADAEVQVLLDFYNAGRAKSGFEGGIEMALRRLLVSPEFLFRVESDPPGVAAGSAYRLSDLEIASRLSFLIWSSIPDEELLDVAIKGTLSRPGVLERQVRRMLADSRAEALATNFAGQWLYLRTIEGSSPDVYLFPNFGENLRQDFRRETEMFFQSILRENRSVLDLLTADYTFVNERLAKHYGIPNVYGSHFRRVTIADPNRRGLLGHGSILTVTSLADRTTVVGRGKWILENLLGAPPPPPPADIVIPPLQENKPGGKVVSVRARMEQHRANPVCASCHARMDPLGFALENFDATGQWRTYDGDVPIDSSAVLPDGTKIEGPTGLRAMLLNDPEQIVTAVTERLLTYALGRGVEYYDAPAVRRIVRDAATSGYSLQALILGVAGSTPFQMRRTSSEEAEAPVRSVASHRGVSASGVGGPAREIR